MPKDNTKEIHRRHPAQVGTKTFEAAIDAYSEDDRETLRWLYYLARDEDWSLNRLAKETKISAASLSKLFRGRYGAEVGAMVDRLRKWREHWLANEQVGKPDFMRTSIADQVYFACEKATVAKVVVLLHGVMGLGKTEALEQYAAEHNHGKTIMIRCPSNGGYGRFIKSIAKQIGISTHSNLDFIQNAILENIRRRAHLVIFDELHEPFVTGLGKLPLRCCEFIRELYDCCKVGLVLCGTQVLPDALSRGNFAAALGQLTDRGSGVEIALDPNIPESDLKLFYQHYNLPDPTGDAREIVDATLSIHSLRRLCFLLQDAQRLARRKKQPLTWDHFVIVHDTLSKLRAPKKRKSRNT